MNASVVIYFAHEVRRWDVGQLDGGNSLGDVVFDDVGVDLDVAVQGVAIPLLCHWDYLFILVGDFYILDEKEIYSVILGD